MFRTFIVFILLQTLILKGLFQNEDWNPFSDRDGKVYRYVPHKQMPNIREYLANDEKESSKLSSGRSLPNVNKKSQKTTAVKPNKTAPQPTKMKATQKLQQTTEKNFSTTAKPFDKFMNVPEKYKHKCQGQSKSNDVYVASNLYSGRYCILMDILISCMLKTNRSNGYPEVEYIKEPEKRYATSKQNSALLMGAETHIFSFFFVCSFFESNRIRCESKTAHFPALSEIIPTSSFSFQDPKDNKRWILVVDSIGNIASNVTEGQKKFERHYIENGTKLLASVPQEYETNASTIYLKHKYFIEGFSFVKQFYYKFYFLTDTSDFTQNKEILRMLWGNTEEFIGCPKSLCSASVVDTVIKLKDNTTYVFVGKYYWNLTAGLGVENAVFIEVDSPFDTHFPYLLSNIDCSFYDIDEDEAYLFKGQYVYSFIKTDALPPARTTPNLYGMHITDVLPGLPPDMNAAFFYRPNSTVYFFREYHYWAYDLRKKRMLFGYPRPVTDFENMPHNIDAISSDNSGKYYVFSGTFYAEFNEEEFKIGMKLEFKVSNVDFFECNKTYFADYNKYKYEMETKFPTVSAKTILSLTNNEGLQLDQREEAEKAVLQTMSPTKQKLQSFLTSFADLIIFGPFFYQLFTDQTPHKSKESIYEAFDE